MNGFLNRSCLPLLNKFIGLGVKNLDIGIRRAVAFLVVGEKFACSENQDHELSRSLCVSDGHLQLAAGEVRPTAIVLLVGLLEHLPNTARPSGIVSAIIQGHIGFRTEGLKMEADYLFPLMNNIRLVRELKEEL